MHLWQEFIRNIFYSGLTRQDYDLLEADINEQNRKALRNYSVIGGCMLLLLTVASIFSGSLAAHSNTLAYGVSALMMALIFFAAVKLAPDHPGLVRPLVYLFELTVYAFATYISLLHRDLPAVSAVVMLFVGPLLFLDRPINMAALTGLTVTVFCLLAKTVKDPSIAADDIWNMITFGILAIAINLFVMRLKVRSLSQHRKITHLSRIDLLTGLKNRNCYEAETKGLFDVCQEKLACVYADVNGLHAMNNEHGHEAGDRMLQAVANEMSVQFSGKYGYRVGGDEFVFFIPDGDEGTIQNKADAARKRLESLGYHTALGVACGGKQGGDITQLVKIAENGMYDNKRSFYQQPENNRRQRR